MGCSTWGPSANKDLHNYTAPLDAYLHGPLTAARTRRSMQQWKTEQFVLATLSLSKAVFGNEQTACFTHWPDARPDTTASTYPCARSEFSKKNRKAKLYLVIEFYEKTTSPVMCTTSSLLACTSGCLGTVGRQISGSGIHSYPQTRLNAFRTPSEFSFFNNHHDDRFSYFWYYSVRKSSTQ